MGQYLARITFNLNLNPEVVAEALRIATNGTSWRYRQDDAFNFSIARSFEGVSDVQVEEYCVDDAILELGIPAAIFDGEDAPSVEVSIDPDRELGDSGYSFNWLDE